MTHRNPRGDQARRELERSRDAEAQADYLNERRRAGEISEGAILALSDLGYEPALILSGSEGVQTPAIYSWASLRYPDRHIFELERRIESYGRQVLGRFALESLGVLIDFARRRGMLVHDSNRETELFKDSISAVPTGAIGVDEIVVEYGLAPVAYMDLCSEVLEDPESMLPNAAEIRGIEARLEAAIQGQEAGEDLEAEISELEGLLHYAMNPGTLARDMRDAAHVASEFARDDAENSAFHLSDQSPPLPLYWFALAEACASLIDLFFGFRTIQGEGFSFTQSGTVYLPNEDLRARGLLEVMANCAYGYGHTTDPTNFRRPFGIALDGFDSVAQYYWPNFVSDFRPVMIDVLLEGGL